MRFLESAIHGTVIGICKMFHSQMMLGTYRLKQTCFFTTSGFLVTMGLTFMEYTQRKVMGYGVGLAWASGLHGILALLPFSSQTFQQNMYHRRTFGLYGDPPFPAKSPHSQTMKELPCSSLGLFQMAYWLLPMSVGSFRTLFMFQVPCPSHSKS